MLKVVSNTTPIVSLLKLNKLDLLHQLYNQIYIPTAVYKEVEAGKDKVYYQNLSKIDWINIIDIDDKQAVKYFLDLDSGEAEAIVLATELNADLILMDEKLGRYYAKHAELKITGTIGILIKAKSNGFIDELKPLIEELMHKGVWIKDNLKSEILKLIGEE